MKKGIIYIGLLALVYSCSSNDGGNSTTNPEQEAKLEQFNEEVKQIKEETQALESEVDALLETL